MFRFQSVVNGIFEFVFRYADLLVSFFIGILIFAIFVLGILIFSLYSPLERAPKVFHRLAFLIISFCLVSWLGYGSYHRWVSTYQPKPLIEIPQQDFSRITWVKTPLEFYYIQENQLNVLELPYRSISTIFQSQGAIKEYHFSPNGQVSFNQYR